MDPDLPLMKWMETPAPVSDWVGSDDVPHAKRHPYFFSTLHLSFHDFSFRLALSSWGYWKAMIVVEQKQSIATALGVFI